MIRLKEKVVIIARDFITEGNSEAYQLLINAGFDAILKQKNEYLTEDALIELFDGADAVIVANNDITDKVISSLPDLKLISRRGVGLDAIDLESAKRNNVAVTRTVGKVESGVAELVLAYMLEFGRQITLQDSEMKNRIWNRVLVPGLETRTIGLVGFGGIGQEIAKRAKSFGMNIIYYNRHPNKTAADALGAEYAELDELLAKSDFVSINVPLTEDTTNLISMRELKLMKPSSYLINIARSQVVNVKDLLDALKEGVIAGAAVDVYEKEPCTDSILVDAPNIILTPHVGPFTEVNFANINMAAAENVIEYFRK